MDISKFKVNGNSKFKLSDVDTSYSGKIASREEAEKYLQRNIGRMAEQQDRLYAQDKYALLIIFQAMDTAGKDGAVKHVMTGLNPQATQVYSFKQPSNEELNHDYLWRSNKCLPERGHIGIFNRSYYEEVLVVRVHDLIKTQRIPGELVKKDIWEDRYGQIREYERYLFNNGIIPVKIFLHISKEEQKQRLLERIDDRSKNWKFSEADIKEREYWGMYQKYYQEVINETGTKHSPWYVVPSDRKWFSRLVISEIIIKNLEKLKLEYPKVSDEQREALKVYREKLLNDQ